MAIKDIDVWGTVMEGQKLKRSYQAQRDSRLNLPFERPGKHESARATSEHLSRILNNHT